MKSIVKIQHICRYARCNGRRFLSTTLGTRVLPYDVIVVGGGHAGTEAACAAARMGVQTLLVTHKFETIGEMSCNPSFGGIGKGHLMKEIDALDGVCARICDKSGIQYKVLNRSRGPAVWGPRAQIDRDIYKRYIHKEVKSTDNLTIEISPVEDLILKQAHHPDHELMKQECCGVKLGDGKVVYGKTVILTAGTFLRGSINIGLDVYPAGRMGDQAAVGLAKSIENAGFTIGRLKTGTPPRLDGKTIDFSRTEPKYGDDPPQPFSYLNDEVWIKSSDQVPCYMTQTNEDVDKICMETLHLNRHVQEETNGPRFCPSIESKVIRFKGRRHRIWLEPEGLSSDIIYPNGISCTMPEEHQVRLIHSIVGLEKAQIVKPGYGVEYDYMDPRQLRCTLETLRIQNLYFAGQINGTTGYEEAAAQGIIAGINAALKVQNKPALIVDRTEGYIGVLIDDLTTHGTNEPYRMFTSRSEFRLALRPDNADRRLTAKGYKSGCVSQYRYDRAMKLESELLENIELLKYIQKPVTKWRALLNMERNNNTTIRSIFDLLNNSFYRLDDFIECYPTELGHLKHNNHLKKKLEIEAIYASEMESQLEEINEVRKDEQLVLPDNLDYMSLQSISTDARVKLAEARPQTIAAASRIPGMTPAAIVKLLKHVKMAENSSVV